MAVSVEDIAGLKNKKIYDTSNEKIVLAKDYERIIHAPLYTILGFLNGYMYASTGPYLTKNTLEGNSIVEIYLEVEHAAFYEGLPYFYAYMKNTIYKITENMEVEWSIELDDTVKSISVDLTGSFYVVFESSKTIVKFANDGSDIVHILESSDPTKKSKIHCCEPSKGAGWIYIVGNDFWDYDGKVECYIDKYNTRTWEKMDRVQFYSGKGASPEDPSYIYNKIYLVGDYFYIFTDIYILKMNIKGIPFWIYNVSYNPSTNTFDKVTPLEYSDNTKTEYLYFLVNLYSSNGFSFGKLSIGGNTLWKITMTDSLDDNDFKICIYRNKIYTTHRSLVDTNKGYILSLNNDRVLFRARSGHLIEILEYNDEELFSPNNYYRSYLLADTIKEGIDKIIYHPLRHDNGDVVNEDFDVLLLPEENFRYTDIENYDTKYLLCSEYRVTANEFSIVFGKNFKPVITKLKNAIRTKQPYLPDRFHEFILSAPGNRINTMQDYSLIRSRFQYSFDKYLLADRNMYFSSIITKLRGLSIITKKDGYYIIRKKREIYTYLLSRYDDINIVTEWLKENGVMDTNLPKYVGDLIHHTLGYIQDIQIAAVPTVYDIQPYKQHEYTFNGYEYPNNTWGTQIFSCTNLPFDKRKCFKTPYIDSLANIIKEQEMRPILLFLNGKAIKWSDCTVVRDWSYTYLLINNTDPYENDLSCVILPCDIRYGEDNNCLSEDVCDTYMYFDKDGLLTDDRSKVELRIEIIDENIVGGTFTYDEKYIEVENEYKQRASDRNILVFEDNKLFPDARYYIQAFGKDIFTYLGNTDSSIFKTFYWIKANDYYGLLYKIPNGSVVKDTIIEHAVEEQLNIKDKNNPSIGYKHDINKFIVPFNYKMYRDKSYPDNVANAVDYIMSYDMSLLIQYYKDQSHIKSYVYSGKYLIDRVPADGGWLIMPRHRKQKYDDYIMVFRNNHLYEYYKEIQYNTHYFKIPIFNHVGRDDVIEIVHFKEVDNSFYHLTISEDKKDYIPEGLRYDNFLLFANSPSGKQYYDKFNIENSIQYDVGFEYKNTHENGKYKYTEFKLSDPYYMDKEINICSKRQFRHMYYNIFYDRDTVNLDPTFKFCHDKTKYMIFLNWRLLTRDDWDLNIMTNESPKKYISITTKYEMKAGDKLEIFYLPMSFDEIDISEDIDRDLYNKVGDIQINTERLGYCFDKDLYMLAINGNKINYSIIENIDNHRCRLTEDPLYDDPELPVITTRSDLRLDTILYRFLQPDKLLSKLYSYSDRWSDAVDSLSPADYEKLLVEKTNV